jgi:diguanylate cyclase (GGDEF)-like protein/PAS domain S-box-containing protein
MSELPTPTESSPDDYLRYKAAIRYIRSKVDQLLALMGTLPLRPEELDDETLLELDPIGIVAGSFSQIISHLNDTNHDLKLARREIRAILDALDAAVIVVNQNGTLDDCNRQARERFFSGDIAAIGQPLNTACTCELELTDLMTKGVTEQERIIDGHAYLMISSHILDEQGAPAKIVLLLFDISRQKAAEANLRLYAQVFEHTGEGIVITDRDNRIVQVNAAFTQITGYSAEDVLGHNPRILNSGLHPQEFYQHLWKSLSERGYWRGEIQDRTKDGSIVPLLYSISQVRDTDGQLTHHIALITDITHLKETQSRLDFLAHHDGLTKLSNRLLFNDRLTQAIARAKRDSTMFGVLFIDLDRFKNINDSLGHPTGDQVLVEVARRLIDLMRSTDTVARLGGDEFVVLVEQVSQSGDIEGLANKILAALREPFYHLHRELHLGCSIGIAIFPEDGLDASELMKNADAAMYRAKESGRDNHTRFSQNMADSADARLGLENALRQAERRHEFVLHYQPIIDLVDNRVRGAEALIRWPGGPAGSNSPDIFIPVAEETRLILPIGDWVLRTALAQFRAWRQSGLDLDYISVNISAVQLTLPEFSSALENLLDEIGVNGHSLILELTENVLMQDIEICRPLLGRLRERGIRIAIDDFGTGYSSLSYLKQLPIDNLKIDRSFVSDIPADANDSAITQVIIGMARTLGLRAIAEGIETEAQETFLREVGCQLGQGFRYAKALPDAEFQAFVRNRG